MSIVTGSKQERQSVDRNNARRYASNIRLAEVRAGWRTSTGACQIVSDVDEIGHSKTMEKAIRIREQMGGPKYEDNYCTL